MYNRIVGIILLFLTVFAIATVFLSLGSKVGIHVYDYSSSTSGFTYRCYPEKGRRLENMLKEKSNYDEENNSNSQICRNFRKDYLKFWLWQEYLHNPYYQFPYCDPLPPKRGN